MAKAKEKPETNIEEKVKGDTLTLTVDLSEELKESSTGRSIIIAQNEGTFKKIEDADGYMYKLIVIKSKKKDK